MNPLHCNSSPLDRSLSMKSLLLDLNLNSESIPVTEIYVFALKLCSGSIPVNKINVLELKIELWLDPCR